MRSSGPAAQPWGGTGQAIRIAKHYDVPVFDLAIESQPDRVMGLWQ